jgi:hypothetical protein
MTDNLPCAVCDRRVYLDEEHVRLTAEYRGTPGKDKEYVAHIQCMYELDEAEP